MSQLLHILKHKITTVSNTNIKVMKDITQSRANFSLYECLSTGNKIIV